MSKYKLVPEDSPVLMQKAAPYEWALPHDELTDLVANMFAIMVESNGVGLAAPQIGVSSRVLVINYDGELTACINPEIVSGTGEVSSKEGCLSFPGLWLNVKRYETIEVKYWDVSGTVREETWSGFKARIYQHELDHLDGICFVKRVGPVALALAKKKRTKASF